MAHHEPRLARGTADVSRARRDDHRAVALPRSGLLRCGDGLGRAPLGGFLLLLSWPLLGVHALGLLPTGLLELRVVILDPRHELVLVAALLEPADLELLLQLVNGHRGPALFGRLSLGWAHRILTLSLPACARN